MTEKQERDEINRLRREGQTYTGIAKATGMTRPRIKYLVQKMGRDGTLADIPGQQKFRRKPEWLARETALKESRTMPSWVDFGPDNLVFR